MDSYDNFHTLRYKGGYIHTCSNRTTCHEEVQAQYKDRLKDCTSLHSAKVWITQQMKGEQRT